MAFLDNSGDIILDAVLTDTGRMRLARGDGSFKIVKFALGDDEIDYSKYNSDHANGSAYFDLEILQSPVFEAFTNNRSLMKSKLVSYSRTNLLYLPVIKWFYEGAGVAAFTNQIVNVFVDIDTEKLIILHENSGVVKGATGGGPSPIVLEQGLNTTDISYMQKIDPDLKETQYIIEMDNRFGHIVDDTSLSASPSFVDDDNIASYYLSANTDPTYIITTESAYHARTRLLATNPPQAQQIQGPFGSVLMFGMKSSIDLQSSNYLFTLLGSTTTLGDLGYSNIASPATSATQVRKIESTVRITGATTGYTVDIPVRFVKKV